MRERIAALLLCIYLCGIIPSWFWIGGLVNGAFTHEFPTDCNAGFSEVYSAALSLAWPIFDPGIYFAFNNGRWGWLKPWYETPGCQ